MNENKLSQVLFVDDDEHLLQGLRRLLRPMRKSWSMEFVTGNAKTVEELQNRCFDVVVSDMRMPGTSGAELLGQVRKTCPRSVRIILSGQAEQESIFQSLGVSHQYLTKPCDAELLKKKISQACAAREILENEEIAEVISAATFIPTAEPKVRRLRELLSEELENLNEVERIISDDAGLSLKVLQCVNSSYFGTVTEETSPENATQLIGAKNLSGVFNEQFQENSFHKEDTPLLERYSIASSSALGLALAASESLTDSEKTLIQVAVYTIDSARLLLIRAFEETYQSIFEKLEASSSSLLDLEQETLSANSLDAGAFLASLWGLPNQVTSLLETNSSDCSEKAERFIERYKQYQRHLRTNLTGGHHDQ